MHGWRVVLPVHAEDLNGFPTRVFAGLYETEGGELHTVLQVGDDGPVVILSELTDLQLSVNIRQAIIERYRHRGDL